ncbi:MAG: glycosyltransferase family 9 protein [SAR324 cluster bacterium]|nr:glycosyltransferase family 9 protein [SAR324 cluster bacterium]
MINIFGFMAYFIKKPKSLPKRLLIARTDRIGDFILTLPAIQAAKTQFGLHVSVLCQEAVAPLLLNNPYVDEVIAINSKAEPRQTVGMIFHYDFDAILVMVNDSNIKELLPFIKKEIPVRIGPLSKPKMAMYYNYPVLQKRSKSIQNEAEYNLELLEVFGKLETKEIRPEIYMHEAESLKAETKIRELFPELNPGYVVMHSGMSGSALNWPLGHYHSLLQMLVEKGIQVVLTGVGDGEKRRNKELASDVASNVFDCSNQVTLRELAFLCSRSGLFIGPSTGPTHVANAAGATIISFYPPIQVQTAKRWAPYMAKGHIYQPLVNCPEKYSCKGEACPYFDCMNYPGPEEVFAKALELLG